MTHVFHHNDIDGHASAYLVWAAMPNEEIRFISCDYTFPLTDRLDGILPEDTVYIVDYSFKENTLAELQAILAACNHVVWIDHHLCSVELITNHLELASIPGVIDTSHSAAVLTYNWFVKDSRIPLWVQLVSDYDTWQKKLSGTDEFYFGLMASDWSVESDLWDSLFDMAMVWSVTQKGQAILDYLRIQDKNHIERYGFVTEFQGYRCLAVNTRYQTSMIFESCRDEFPVCVMFQFTGRCWKYTICTNGEVNASHLAAAFGGGGHQGAAGFTTDTLLPCFCREVE